MLSRALASLALLASVVHAQTAPLPREADTLALSEKVVKSVAEGQWKAGWDAIRAASVIPVNELNVVEAQIVGEMEKISTRLGKPIAHEFILTERVGVRLVRHQFLVHHEKSPIRWMLVFYSTGSGWVLTDFKFDGNYSVLFPKGV
jgi:hypothetical protein